MRSLAFLLEQLSSMQGPRSGNYVEYIQACLSDHTMFFPLTET